MPRKKKYETKIKRPDIPAWQGKSPKDQEPLWEQDQEELMLEGTEWTKEHWAFIVWEATPIPVRVPTMLEGIAERIGVTPRTLQNWRKMPRFREQVRAIARNYLEVDLPSVYYALADQAKTGSYPHIKLFLEMLGEYVERFDYTSGGKPFPIQTYDYGPAIAALTRRPDSDSEAPG